MTREPSAIWLCSTLDDTYLAVQKNMDVHKLMAGHWSPMAGLPAQPMTARGKAAIVWL